MTLMKRDWFCISAALIGLLLFLAGPAAADNGQSGLIVVGVVPVAQFDAFYAFSTVPTKVTFIDNSAGYTPMTREWAVGDGTTSSEQNPEHTYLRRGTYTVALTVKNAYGTSTATKKNYIPIGMEPKADFSGSPDSGDAPLTVKFSDRSSGQVTRWNWDFGDGKGSSEQGPVHTYWSGGNYNVILTASNDYGSSDITKTHYIRVTGDLRTAFAADPASGKAPLAVKFTDRSIGNPATWAWDFGDGSNSTGQNPVHVFARTGTYDVRLTVTRGGIGDTSTQIINVGGVPVADFNGTPRSGNVGEQIRFLDMTENNPDEWSWDFGDTAVSDARNPSHAYQLKGIYTVSLTAKNSNGIDTETKEKYINIGIGPRSDFVPVIIPYQKNSVPLQVQFVDQSANVPTSWEWDFGDGANSTEQNPVHQYNTPGKFSGTLNVSNANGQDSTVKADFIITTPAPVADFRADRQSGNAPFVVRFTDLSKGSPDTWSWDFGDGTGYEEQNPSHIYMNEGTYDVRLTVSNQHGSDSVSLKDTSSARATTAPSGTPAATMTSSPLEEVPLTSASPAPAATKSPLSMGIAVFALLAGLLLIAAGKRR